MKPKQAPVIETEAAIQTPYEERFLLSYWDKKIKEALSSAGFIEVFVYQAWQVRLVAEYGIVIPDSELDQAGRMKPTIFTLSAS